MYVVTYHLCSIHYELTTGLLLVFHLSEMFKSHISCRLFQSCCEGETYCKGTKQLFSTLNLNKLTLSVSSNPIVHVWNPIKLFNLKEQTSNSIRCPLETGLHPWINDGMVTRLAFHQREPEPVNQFFYIHKHINNVVRSWIQNIAKRALNY